MTERRPAPKWMAVAEFVAAVAVLTAACGGGDDDDDAGGTSGRVGACDLVTAQEAEDILGEAVEAGEAGSTPPYETCTYNVESLAIKFVLVQQRTEVSRDDFIEEIISAAELLDEEAVEVDGIGDAAFRLSGLLYAHDGDTEVVTTVVLGVGDDNEEEVIEAEKELAIKALDRAK